jgi:aryl-alcohol dehydrogenase-like predicted oxidoreductase
MVSPIGLGAMQLAGPGVFGPPADIDEARLLLREAVECGVNHIDTSEYYGPTVVNELIRSALHPYPSDLVIVSKVGAARGSRGEIFAYDEPPQLRLGIEDNLRSLRVDSLPVVNLRLMRGGPPDGFFDDQLAAMVEARDDGLIAAVGLSGVSVDHLRRALDLTEIACVQNSYHLANRRSEAVLDECRRQGIAFVPFAPLGSGAAEVLGSPTVNAVANRLDCTPAQVALAWTLGRGPNVLLIPGTSSRRHIRENLAAVDVVLDEASVADLSSAECRW